MQSWLLCSRNVEGDGLCGSNLAGHGVFSCVATLKKQGMIPVLDATCSRYMCRALVHPAMQHTSAVGKNRPFIAGWLNGCVCMHDDHRASEEIGVVSTKLHGIDSTCPSPVVISDHPASWTLHIGLSLDSNR